MSEAVGWPILMLLIGLLIECVKIGWAESTEYETPKDDADA